MAKRPAASNIIKGHSKPEDSQSRFDMAEGNFYVCEICGRQALYFDHLITHLEVYHDQQGTIPHAEYVSRQASGPVRAPGGLNEQEETCGNESFDLPLVISCDENLNLSCLTVSDSSLESSQNTRTHKPNRKRGRYTSRENTVGHEDSDSGGPLKLFGDDTKQISNYELCAILRNSPGLTIQEIVTSISESSKHNTTDEQISQRLMAMAIARADVGNNITDILLSTSDDSELRNRLIMLRNELWATPNSQL